MQLVQLSVFALLHQLQGAGELCDGAAQVQQQLCHIAPIVLLHFSL